MFRILFRNILLLCSFLLITTLASCNRIPGYMVVGQLFDSDGNPIEAAEIVIGQFINFTGQFHSFSIPYEAGNPYGSTTDKDGKFQIFAELSGSYLLLYESVIDEVGMHALTDSGGNVVILELSETEGANAGKVFIDNYPDLPKKHLPEFLNNVSIGMTFEDLESKQNNLIMTNTTEGQDYFEIAVAEPEASKAVYGFDTSNNRLETLEIQYTDENGAFTFGEMNFGIPNYQGSSSNGKSVIYWYFNHGNKQVLVIATGSKLIYQILD